MTDDDRTLTGRIASLWAEAQETQEADNADVREAAGGWRDRIDDMDTSVWVWNLAMLVLNLSLLAVGAVGVLNPHVGATIVGIVLVLVGLAGLADALHNRMKDLRDWREGNR